MSSSTSCSGLLLVLIALTGCDRSQPWTFRNGRELGDAPPPSILSEIYDGECGPCAPMGSRMYCELVEGRLAGARPTGLEDGKTYCFMGTALDDTGAAYAIGCETVVVGQGGGIDITLAPIDADRVIARRCLPDIPDVDAGAPFDAGPGMDAGRIDGFDAGPPPPDAGPAVDSGLSFGDPITVRFIPNGPGAFFLSQTSNGALLGGNQPIRQPRARVLNAYVGFGVTIDAEPDTGAFYVGIPGGCGTRDPCSVVLDQNEDIVIRFADAPPM